MKKILIIEDDADISAHISQSLKAEGYIPEVVYDGLMAERILSRTTFDAVIIDVNIPGRSGVEVCRNFRKSDVQTPVLFLTAFNEIEDKAEGFEAGADDYLTKPFFMKELLMRVGALIRRRENKSDPSRSNLLVMGDLEINTATAVVKVKGEDVVLTPREFQILLRLVQAEGQLVSKPELVKEIWGGSFDTNTNTIEVYINFLRKKIDRPFGRDSIRTKIGFGYFYRKE